MDGNFYYGIIQQSTIYPFCQKCKKRTSYSLDYQECFCNTCPHDNESFYQWDLIFTSQIYDEVEKNKDYGYWNLDDGTHIEYYKACISENPEFCFPNYEEESKIFNIYKNLNTEQKRIVNSTIKVLIKKIVNDIITTRKYPFKKFYYDQLFNCYAILQNISAGYNNVVSSEIILWDKKYKPIKTEYDLLVKGKSRFKGHFNSKNYDNYSLIYSYKLINISLVLDGGYYPFNEDMRKFVSNYRKLYKNEKKLIRDLIVTLNNK